MGQWFCNVEVDKAGARASEDGYAGVRMSSGRRCVSGMRSEDGSVSRSWPVRPGGG